MRIIGHTSNPASAKRFSDFLSRHGIENRYELTPAGTDYDIWVSDEDRISEANELLKRFEANPFDPIFDVEIQPKEAEEEEEQEEPLAATKNFYPYITIFFLALCSFVFSINWVQELSLRHDPLAEVAYLPTPLQTSLLFDVPPVIEKTKIFFETHPFSSDQTKETLAEQTKEIKEIEKIPYWRGFYEWILLKVKTGDTSEAEGELFIKIREGQIWRFFSPAVLHRDLIHILFNMIWLWVLGRSIEVRIGAWRTILLTLIVGVISNTIQYLMSGPLFLGYSGIVMGLAGFIWARERWAPWEGYPVQRSTLLFLVFFVLAMFLLQALSFIIQITTELPFILNIANSAHIAGAIIGVILGRLSYFAWRVR